MSAQAVNFQLFIRSGRGAAHSQRDCLNLTIVSFHSISSNSLKIGFGRSTLEGRFCESWNFFALPYSTGITKKKKLSSFYESNASNPVWAWPDMFSSDLSGLLITIQLSPRKVAKTQRFFRVSLNSWLPHRAPLQLSTNRPNKSSSGLSGLL